MNAKYMNTKHTAGPWKLEYKTSQLKNSGTLLTVDGNQICGLLMEFGRPSAISENEAEANAKLIAAAPELLEALQGLVRSNTANGPARMKTALAAIKKATE